MDVASLSSNYDDERNGVIRTLESTFSFRICPACLCALRMQHFNEVVIKYHGVTRTAAKRG